MFKFRALIFGFVSLALVSTGMKAEASCYDKYAFDQIRLHSEVAIIRGIVLTQSQQAGLDRAMRQLTLSPIEPLLEKHGMAGHIRFLRGFISELTTMQREGVNRSRRLNKVTLDKAGQIFEALCSVETPVESPSAVSPIQHIKQRIFSTFSNDAVQGSKADVRSFLNLSYVFFILLGLISSIVIVWKSYAIAFPYLMNRKICKIPASLRLLDASVSGNIVVLGARGARFVPSDPSEQAHMISLLRKLTVLPKTSLVVRGEAYSVNLRFVSIGHCVSLFESSLDRGILNRLYRCSLEQPKFAPRSSVITNMKSINPNFS